MVQVHVPQGVGVRVPPWAPKIPQKSLLQRKAPREAFFIRIDMTSARPATFRQAALHDIPAMSAIRLAVRENVLSNPDRITRQMYEDYLDVLGRGWVAEIDGEVAGFSYADKTNASIWALFISPDHEGKGLAKQLLNLATGWLFEQGHAGIR